MVRRCVRACGYFATFPAFMLAALAFYVVLRVHLCGVRHDQRCILARRYIHRGARLLFGALRTCSLVDVSVDLTRRSDKASDRATVVVANHPSMLDAMLLMTVYPNAVCIMKQSLMRLPIISGFASLARYIPQVDTPELLSAASGVLKAGGSIVIFPEGTRSPKGSLGELKRGAARIAVEERVPIDVFALSMDPVVLGRGASWWKPPGERVRYRAVRIESGLTASDVSPRGNPDVVRAEAVCLTRSIEICLRNSLSYPGDDVVSGDL